MSTRPSTPLNLSFQFAAVLRSRQCASAVIQIAGFVSNPASVRRFALPHHETTQLHGRSPTAQLRPDPCPDQQHTQGVGHQDSDPVAVSHLAAQHGVPPSAPVKTVRRQRRCRPVPSGRIRPARALRRRAVPHAANSEGIGIGSACATNGLAHEVAPTGVTPILMFRVGCVLSDFILTYSRNCACVQPR